MKDLALIAELGHQACRFALLRAVENGRPIFSHEREYSLTPGSNVMAIIGDYIEGLDRPAPRSLSVAVAAPVTGDSFTITSSGWTCTGTELRETFGFERIIMHNETAARGMALDFLRPDEVIPVGGHTQLVTPLAPGRYAMVSPDMGLGVCVADIGENGSCNVVGTEGGHMAFAPQSELETELLCRLTRKYGRTSYERIISWSGLSEIYATLCERSGTGVRQLTPLEIVLYSRTGADPLCVEAMNCFASVLGDYTGDVAMVLGADRGVFLTGRFIVEAHEAIASSVFRQRFETKGRLSGFVQALPTWAVVSTSTVLTGMARFFIEAMAANPDTFGLPVQEDAYVEPAAVASEAADPQQLAATILSGAGAGLLVLDADLRIVSANERYWDGSSVPLAMRTAGMPIAPCIQMMAKGRDWSEETASAVLAGLEAGQLFLAERKAFGGRVLCDEFHPVPSGGWVATAKDITISRNRAVELESITGDLRLAKTAADAANGAKTVFLATMSHEIRTPLNGILGMAQAMAVDSLDPQQASRLDIIRQSGENLLAILNDILDLSKIEAGKLEIEEVEFDLDHLLMGAHSTFTALANKKGLSFCLATTEGASGVYLGDPTRLRQILYNLVSNAIKFTQSGEVRVDTQYEDGKLRMAVTDTGIGIPADRLSALFEKFVQVDASTTRQYGGTGLGLSICRDLAGLMGGAVEVTSEMGKGTRFELVLPLERLGDSKGAASFAAPVEIDTGDDGPALRVLAAEDNTVNQLVLKTLLGQMGVEVTVVDDGEQAVEAWENGEWDVILMDVQMPKMDGPTAVKLIRAKEAATGRARTPIIALTANVMTHQINEYLGAGMDDCVGKPLQITALIESIVRVTEGPQDEAGEETQAA